MEYDLVNNKGEAKRLNAVRNIRNLITEIDFKVEVVPLENKDRLVDMLVSLKGEKLSIQEVVIVDELVSS